MDEKTVEERLYPLSKKMHLFDLEELAYQLNDIKKRIDRIHKNEVIQGYEPVFVHFKKW